ncbi:molybdenum cofactor guanylyltransferase [Acinetobacter genomosp. 15BJ]|uniref:Molybdenum cofactor guanylyltransferase n=1 Tax=Acinetobacter genomosp. 15BJ TaxID=106651 RepID=R9AYV1_9GAMM|nr:NTP transferase domain-containing protein [Acinetobacter genomosp. 15BJ]EOR07444.1 molybdopterin-guanine dinucleotide biosynthesis protein A [Acinetobacter genomosp. 15BJ]MCH7291482.1 NTP transferase domain-containing protein [Acinetobacter genomosp. 15BJ]MDO3657880.1 NTP transferase domain-containing protein [Acinetobacter genomosp. 15BJ]
MNTEYPATDLVILAGGQARRMNGTNKLLQQFDDQIQLSKICESFKTQVQHIWVNSHRDSSIYKQIEPDIECYADDQQGFLGPLMGMKSAWSHLQADYALFIPCDVTYIPSQTLVKLHRALQKQPLAQVAYVNMNGDALYPFCLLKRESLSVLEQAIAENRLSLRDCFKQLDAQAVAFQKQNLFFHSINSLDELQQYKQLSSCN